MVALCIGCVVIGRETIFTATMGLWYAVAWFAFYYRAVWATAAP